MIYLHHNKIYDVREGVNKMTIEELNSFWDQYEKPYIADGIDINHLNEYLSQNVKVLFVLKETNESKNIERGKQFSVGEHKSLFEESGWFYNYANGNCSDGKLITKIIRMYKYITSEDSDKNTRDFSALPEDVYSFAFININKHGNGGERTDLSKLKEIFNKDKDKLKLQIEILNPDVIVSGVKGIDIKSIVSSDVIFIQTRHFSRMGYNEFEEECKNKL